ncbi:MAG: BREX system Lon protease-like protein BrxL [Planctomycetes bacterium]|nr:BREX system Lon protease-like protein BrxL [Planctomycetota bacterium]
METTTHEPQAPEAYEAKVRRLFGDRIVDKGLAQQEAFARLPRYVSEYLIAKYVRPETQAQDLDRIKVQIRERLPDADRRELIKDRLVREGQYVLIDSVEVRVDLRSGQRFATVPALEERNARIEAGVLERNPGLLTGGMWGTVKLWYRPEADPDRPVEVVGFTPFQADVTSVDDVIAARKELTTEEWVRLMLTSVGLDPSAFPSDRVRLLLLARLVPLVEGNVNLIELGPRQTGKTFLLRNTSPQAFVVSGGKSSPANLFVNLSTRAVGIVGSRKVVVFDEVASTTFADAEATVSMLKDYMESGQFSRGAKTYSSDASIVLAGTLDVDGARPAGRYRHLFEALPDELVDAAFLDRIHGYLPGWEIPKVTRACLWRGPAFVTDYFGEYLLALRRLELRGEVHRLSFNQHLTQRDLVAVERLTAGLLKLVHPDGDFTESELAALASLAVEMRQRVHDQLGVLAPGEFHSKAIAFEGMVPSPAGDMGREPEAVQRYDRMNDHALVGEVTGLAVIERDGRPAGGDLIVIEVSMVPGGPGLEVTGGRGVVLRESVRAAYNLVASREEALGIRPGALARSKVLVHLVHIAEEREGPSAGIAFVVGIVSAATGRAVRPALALTGEVSLHGKVTSVGGVAEKVRAAASYGRKVVVVPRENARDLESLPDALLERVEIVPVTTVEEVVEAALLPAAAAPSEEARA